MYIIYSDLNDLLNYSINNKIIFLFTSDELLVNIIVPHDELHYMAEQKNYISTMPCVE